MLRYLITSSIITICVFVQAQEWINCTHGEEINTIQSYGDEIWLGTTGGVVRFNESTGVKTFFNRGNANIPSNNITSIAKDNKDRIWVSTPSFYGSNERMSYYENNQWNLIDTIGGLLSTDNNGNLIVVSMSQLHIFDGTNFSSIEIESLNQCPNPTGVAVNPINNDIWMSHFGFGCFSIIKYDGTSFESFNQSNSPIGFESPNNNPIFVDHTGKVWIGSWNKLYSYDGQGWETYDETNSGFTKGLITSMDQYNEEKIWFGVSNYWSADTIPNFGLAYYDGQNWGEIQLPKKNKFSNDVNAVLIRENDLLIGSAVGFMIYDYQSFKHISSSNSSLKSNKINNLLYNGNEIWYAMDFTRDTSYNKVTKINNGEWTHFTTQNAPFDPTISTQLLTTDQNGTVYVRNNKKIYYYKDNEWKLYFIPDLLEDIDESNAEIRFDNENNPWLFHYNGYIFRFDGTNWITIGPDEHGNQTGYYNGITFDPNSDDLWFADYNFLYHYDGSNWESFHYFDIPAFGNNIRSVAIDSSGLLWIVGGFGISSYDGTSFKGYTNNDIGIPLTNNIFTCLTIDQSGHLWVGGYKTLLYYDGSDWVSYSMDKKGLPDQNISTLISDKYDNLWIGTNNGGLGIFNQNMIEGVDQHTGTLSLNNIEALEVFPTLLQSGVPLTIQLPDNLSQRAHITIIDANGAIVLNKPIPTNTSKLDLELNKLRANSGAYFIQLTSKGKKYISKFIII